MNNNIIENVKTHYFWKGFIIAGLIETALLILIGVLKPVI
jgi:hypothetical protein